MIERYTEKHYVTMCEWLMDKNIGAPDRDLLSGTGFVVDGNAIGFLFKTDSKICYIGEVTANPRCTKEERSKALTMLFNTLEATARESGFTMLTGMTNLGCMEARFLSHDFKKYQAFTLFFKVLGE